MKKADEFSRVEALFHAAMKRSADDRDSYLSDNAVDDTELESARRLVRVAEQAEDFLNTSVGLPSFVPTLKEGDLVKGWRVGEFLGAGGMGEVYRVRRDQGDFEHDAALKMARIKDSKNLPRFTIERQLLARLEHPNIGRLIDGGQMDNGSPFFVMEFIEGQYLTEYTSDRALKIKLFKQLCNALNHAHSRLILHRDIKPSNVMVNPEGEVKLIDFGVSDVMNGETVTTSSPVTSGYAAPEQLAGQPATTATDTYALGALLHELLTGERYKPELGVNTALPKDLIVILEKCLRIDPTKRYGGVEALHDDIVRFEKSEPVSARVSTPIYRLGRFLKRNAVAASILGLLFVSLIGGITGSLIFAERAATETRNAVAALKAAQIAEQEKEFEARTMAGYKYGLQTLYGGQEADGDAINPAQIDASLSKLIPEAEREARAGGLQGAYTLYALGQHYTNRRDFRKAKAILMRLAAISSEDIHLRTEAQSTLAAVFGELGEAEDAIRYAIAALEGRSKYEADHLLGYARDRFTLANATKENRDVSAALETIDEAITAFAETTRYEDISSLYTKKGELHFAEGEMLKATNAFEKAFEIDRLDGVRSPNHLVTAGNLAQFQIYYKRDGSQALVYLPEYLPYTSTEFGEDETENGYFHGLIAFAAIQENQPERAVEAGREAYKKLKSHKQWWEEQYYFDLPTYVRALARTGNAEVGQALLNAEREVWKTEPPENPHSACNFMMADVEIALANNGYTAASEKLKAAVAYCKKVAEPYGDLDLDKMVIVEQIEAEMERYKGR